MILIVENHLITDIKFKQMGKLRYDDDGVLLIIFQERPTSQMLCQREKL